MSFVYCVYSQHCDTPSQHPLPTPQPHTPLPTCDTFVIYNNQTNPVIYSGRLDKVRDLCKMNYTNIISTAYL